MYMQKGSDSYYPFPTSTLYPAHFRFRHARWSLLQIVVLRYIFCRDVKSNTYKSQHQLKYYMFISDALLNRQPFTLLP